MPDPASSSAESKIAHLAAGIGQCRTWLNRGAIAPDGAFTPRSDPKNWFPSSDSRSPSAFPSTLRRSS
jgi:hypothetical protein